MRLQTRALTERLITYDTSTLDGLKAAAGFVKGWLESRDVAVQAQDFNGLPVLTAEVGPPEARTVIFHGHLDVVPGHEDQFEPRVEGDRLIGRGAFDMKGGLAAMMVALAELEGQERVRVRFCCVPDEESEDLETRSTDWLVEHGFRGDFAITGEPTHLHVGVQAKGVLAMRLAVHGRSAHGSTPWLGDNAVLKAIDVFRRIETLPFTRISSELFDRPSVNLGRISGGDALNKVPDRCEIVIDIRYLPGQDPEKILDEIGTIPDVEVVRTFVHEPAFVSREDPYVLALVEAAGGESMSVGRDGASDAISFQRRGIPAVEFGPHGGGHHGPEEWVSVESLDRCRVALVDFVRAIGKPQLRAVKGGRSA